MATEFTLKKLEERPPPMLTFRWTCLKLPFEMDVNYVESISLPFPTVDVGDPLYGGGTFFHFPTFVRLDSFNMTFYEDQNATTYKWIIKWISKIRNFKEGWYNLPGEYKMPIEIAIFDDVEDQIVKATLEGCWPTQIANLDLNYTESNRVIINITFSVDAMKFE